MSPVLALESDGWLRARLKAGVRAGAAHGLVEGVTFASSWSELRELARRFPGSPVFVDPSYPSEKGRRDPSASFQQSIPACPLIRYGKEDGASPNTKADFVARFVPGEDDGLVSIGKAVLVAADYESVCVLLANLVRVAPRDARTLLEHVVHDTVFTCTVTSLAAALGTSIAMLDRRCRSWRLPTPKKLLSLAHLFHVQRVVAWSDRPAGAVALVLGYSAYSNYMRSVRREMECTSSTVAKRGGPQYVAKKLIDTIGGSR